jgi:hypothetical protein
LDHESFAGEAIFSITLLSPPVLPDTVFMCLYESIRITNPKIWSFPVSKKP